MSDTQQTCQPQIVAQAFSEHMQKCRRCQLTVELWKNWDEKYPGFTPPALCEEGRKTLAALFN